MTIMPKCPSCGFESAEVRCPRCNTLKVVGCSGVCSACGSSCGIDLAPPLVERQPSGDDAENPQQAGKPLVR